ncbi:MAG TPA: dTDP-4-dehydrorhamnose reductase [Clostridiales bacterium]|nr:dTDP-4-dehydrorhamnose reductase [Clostridiales bacterium]
MKKVLITGVSGQVGQAIYRILSRSNSYELFLTNRTPNIEHNIEELDISDERAVETIIDRIMPDIIINCAAFTAVDLCESEEDRAYEINALGPKYLAIAAERAGAVLVHLSSDYVFDGNALKPYIESDSTTPISAYGRTKLAGEAFVKENCKKYFILRPAWVYGQGKNFVKTMVRLAESGKDIRVVSDQIGSPTSAIEIARVISFLVKTESYGIYHSTCEGSCSWYDFTMEIMKLAGKDVKVSPITTSEYPTAAKRPMYSVLENKALRERHNYVMKDWKEAFKEYWEKKE